MGPDSAGNPRVSRRRPWPIIVGLLVALAATLTLAGCGGGGDKDGGGGLKKRGGDGEDDGGGGGLKSRNKGMGGDDESGGGAKGAKGGGGGAAPPPPPPMPGGAGGAPGGGAPAAPAAPAVPLDLAKSPPTYPGKPSNPFSPVDKPLKPPETSTVQSTIVAVTPIRPSLVMPPAKPQESQSAVYPPDLRMAGLAGGKAIIEQNGQQYTVWPGQDIAIEFNGQRTVTVVSVSPNGTMLRDKQSGQMYTAPFRR